MKYLLILSILMAQASLGNVPVDSMPQELRIEKAEYITLITPDGEIVQWPKDILPRIKIFSVSTATEHYATYTFTLRVKGGIYKVPVTKESYLRYKAEMGIK
jgi:hypothetical protein